MLANAQSSSQSDASLELEPMVVVTTRTPRPVNDVAGVATVIDAARIEQELAFDLDDLVRYEAGISAETAGTRFGFDGFNIRGIGANRVAIEVDGVPLNDHFDVGSFASAGRGLIDPELIQRVEILRGPASALYGSDAIGGMVAFSTWDPAALAHDGNWAMRVRSGYDGAEDGWFASALVANQQERWGAVAGGVYRQGEQLNHGVNGNGLEDRIRSDRSSGLAKVVVPVSMGEFEFSATHDQVNRDSDIRSLLGQGRFRATTEILGDDEQTRDLVNAGLRLEPMDWWFDSAHLQAFWQESDTNQFTREARASRDQRFARRFLYTQQVSGFDATVFREHQGQYASHRIGMGFELLQTDSKERREALQTDLAGNNPTHEVLGEVFPVRDFPNSRTRETALWMQDEISWDRLTLIPALRYEHYDLDPQPDAVYRDDNPATEVASISESELTPKLGMIFDLNNDWSIFGQYSRGFRAPPFQDANIGLDIPLFNIRAIPNPDLKSETSDGLELGMRFRGAGQQLELVAFHNSYDDFIASKVRLGPDPDTGTLLFQSQNIADATIRGLEFRYEAILARWPQLRFSASGFWSDSEDESTGQPLASVDPAELQAGVRWQPASAPWNLNFNLRHVTEKDTDGLDESQFIPDAYTVLDFQTQWQLSPTVSASFRLGNVLGESYWRWQDVRSLDNDDPVLPLLSQPERNVSATLKWTF